MSIDKMQLDHFDQAKIGHLDAILSKEIKYFDYSLEQDDIDKYQDILDNIPVPNVDWFNIKFTERVLGESNTLSAKQEQALFYMYNYNLKQTGILRDQEIDNAVGLKIVDCYFAAQDIRDKIIKCNLALIVSMAKNFYGRVEEDDLKGESCKILIYCIDKFDVEKGNKFSTYAYKSIHRELVKVNNRDARYRLLPIFSDFGDDFGDSFEDNLCYVDESLPSVLGFLSSKQDLLKLRKTLKNNLASLTENELKVITLRYFSGSDCKTFNEISKEMGLSSQHLFNIEKSAKDKLKKCLK